MDRQVGIPRPTELHRSNYDRVVRRLGKGRVGRRPARANDHTVAPGGDRAIAQIHRLDEAWTARQAERERRLTAVACALMLGAALVLAFVASNVLRTWR